MEYPCSKCGNKYTDADVVCPVCLKELEEKRMSDLIERVEQVKLKIPNQNKSKNNPYKSYRLQKSRQIKDKKTGEIKTYPRMELSPKVAEATNFKSSKESDVRFYEEIWKDNKNKIMVKHVISGCGPGFDESSAKLIMSTTPPDYAQLKEENKKKIKLNDNVEFSEY